APPVGRVHQLDRGLVVRPLVLERTARNLGVQNRGSRASSQWLVLPPNRKLRQRDKEIGVNRQHEKPGRQQRGQHDARGVRDRQQALVEGAQRLQRAPEAVGQVQQQKQ